MVNFLPPDIRFRCSGCRRRVIAPPRSTSRRRALPLPCVADRDFEDVRALVRSILHGRGRMLAVVMIINHAAAGNARVIQDALLEWVYAQPSAP